MNIKQDPAARRAAFFKAQALKAKRIAEEERKRQAAKQFRLDRFFEDCNRRFIATLE